MRVSKTSHQPLRRISALHRFYRGTGLFLWQLNSGKSAIELTSVADPWRGQSVKGATILQAAESSDFDSMSEEFACFDWIRDVQEYGGSNARIFVRTQLSRWMTRHSKWSERYWRPDIMARRISSLLFCYGWYGASASEEFQAHLAQFIAPQVRCLALDWQRLRRTEDKIICLSALILAQAMLGLSSSDKNQKRDVNALFALLMPLLNSQVNDDGGHKSRQPETHIRLLKRLVECRIALSHANMQARPDLDDLIQKMASATKIWRRSDGRFSHFNHAGGMSGAEIDQVLSMCVSKGRIPQYLNQTGFARLSAARTVAIIDTGAETLASDVINPAGRFGFELYVGSTPLIVNSGQYSPNESLTQALRQTVAHSALTLDNHDSDAITSAERTLTRACQVGAAEGGQLFEATHEGYLKSHGILHTRQIFLNKSGKDIRGRDKISYTGAPGEIPRQLIIRFHLHPRVTAAQTATGQIILKVPKSSTSWHFKCRGATGALEPSLYLDTGRRAHCQQIVLSTGVTNIQTVGDAVVSWAFQNRKIT